MRYWSHFYVDPTHSNTYFLKVGKWRVSLQGTVDRGKYSCTGILVFPGWEWKIYYSSRITFHERHVWINLMFLNFVKNFPVRIFWEELLSAQAHIFLVSDEKIPKWISFDPGRIFPVRTAWMKLLLQIFPGLGIFWKN